MRWAALVGIVAVSASLSGCGAPAGTAPPTPRAACPTVEGAPSDPGCAYYDPDKAMGQNELYRQRREVVSDVQERGDALLPRVREALEPFVSGGVEITKDAVTDAILELGVEPSALRLQGDPPRTVGIAIGIDLGGGCLFGGVTTDRVDAEVGGYIMDGGCLVMPTH